MLGSYPGNLCAWFRQVYLDKSKKQKKLKKKKKNKVISTFNNWCRLLIRSSPRRIRFFSIFGVWFSIFSVFFPSQRSIHFQKKKKKSVVERSLDHFTGKECDEKIRQATSQVLFQTKLWIHASLFFNEKKKKRFNQCCKPKMVLKWLPKCSKRVHHFNLLMVTPFFFTFFFRIFFFSLVRFYRKFV